MPPFRIYAKHVLDQAIEQRLRDRGLVVVPPLDASVQPFAEKSCPLTIVRQPGHQPATNNGPRLGDLALTQLAGRDATDAAV